MRLDPVHVNAASLSFRATLLLGRIRRREIGQRIFGEAEAGKEAGEYTAQQEPGGS